MGEPKFTPGPWRVRGRDAIVEIPVWGKSSCAAAYGGTAANAHLIAAAPALFEALKGMEDAICNGFDTREARMAGRKALIAARAALAQALGESQQ